MNVPLNLLVGGLAAYLACRATVLSVCPFQSSHSGGAVRYLIGILCFIYLQYVCPASYGVIALVIGCYERAEVVFIEGCNLTPLLTIG